MLTGYGTFVIPKHCYTGTLLCDILIHPFIPLTLIQSESEAPKCGDSTAEGQLGAPGAGQHEVKTTSEHEKDDDQEEQ